MMKDSDVHLRDAVEALTRVGVRTELAVLMVWDRRISREELWVMERVLLERWLAQLEGGESDGDGS